MGKCLTDPLSRLITASSRLLDEHLSMGTCFPEKPSEVEGEEFTLDESGCVWYTDWYELMVALEEAKEAIR